MEMDEDSKHFFIQFSTFVVTENENVYLKTLLPTWAAPIFDAKVRVVDSDVSSVTITHYKGDFDEFELKGFTQSELTDKLREVYNEMGDTDFDLRKQNHNIILASDLYPGFSPKSFEGEVCCRGSFTGWNDLGLTGSLITKLSLPNTTHFALRPN